MGHRRRREVQVWVAVLALASAGCGGGGGAGGSGFDGHGALLAVDFPDPSGSGASGVPPDQAPLLQQIVFTFDGRPDPNSVGSSSIAIRDDAGFPVAGHYDVDDEVVTFTPRLPTSAPTVLPNGDLSPTDAGLAPGRRYTIRISSSSFRFVSRIDYALLQSYRDPNVANGVLIGFGTTSDLDHLLDGLPALAPLVAESTPEDGATGVSPNLYTDPDHAFDPRAPIILTCERPIRPDPRNLGSPALQLLDLDDRPFGAPGGLSLGINVRVTSNELDGATLEIVPHGILPLGHQLAVAVAPDLKGISEHGDPGDATTILATFTVASSDGGVVHDALVESFEDTLRHEESAVEFAPGSVQAEWDVRGSKILQAGFAFQGNGVLGRFSPPPPKSGDTNIVYLDTTRQIFPLPDGSTPDAPANFEVVGGVFSFTDVDIPAGVVLTPIGGNPLVITATGTFRLGGQIAIQGLDGTSDFAYDSAVSPVPGGPGGSGGGRGGEGQPILFFPTDQVSVLNLVSPPHGGRGWSMDPADGLTRQIGGTGGQSGMLDHVDSNGKYTTNQEITCYETGNDNSNGVKPPGGGGGSLLLSGLHPQFPSGGTHIDGIGNVVVDGQGHYVVRRYTDRTLLGGDGGDWPFYDDGDGTNDFIGPTGQVRRMIGGQGGGAGATRTESYYCGIWCELDTDPNNDANCDGTDFGKNPSYADSVGDARGGGGGGGGGGVMIQSLGALTIDASAAIKAWGGMGGGGEQLGCSSFAGGGGGGSGGAVVLQSGTSILIRSGALIDASAGEGDSASDSDLAFQCDEGGSDGVAIGDGGRGGSGLIQLQVPAGDVASVEDTGSLRPLASWVDRQNVLNPAAFTPDSIALSKWWDLGRAIARPPAGANPAFLFGGLDAFGYVATDADGYVLDPAATDVVCDDLGTIDPVTRQYVPGREPREDYIPPGSRIRVEFQGADALVEGSQEVDPLSLTSWSAGAAVANGHQFLRWRVTFTIADDSHPLGPLSPRPVVQRVTVHSDF